MYTKKDFLHRIVNKIGMQRIKLFLAFICVGMFTHFELYSNHLTNPDGLVSGMWKRTPTAAAQLGRWGIYYIECLRGFLCSPLLVTFLAVMYMSVASLVLIEILGIEKKLSQLTTGILMVSCPAMAMTLSYYYRSDTYMLAMLLACLAVFFLKRERRYGFFLGILCVIGCLSLYQPYIGVTAVLALFIILQGLLKGDELGRIIKCMIRFATVGAIGLVVYYLIANIYLKINGLSFSSYAGADAGALAGLSVWKESIRMIYRNFGQFFFGDNAYLIKNQYWHRSTLNGIFLLLIFVSAVLIIINKKYYKNILRILILIVCILLIPFFACIIRFITPNHNFELLMSAPLYCCFPMGIFVIESAVSSFRCGAEKLNCKVAGTILATGLILLNVLNWTYILSDNATYMYLNLMRSQTLSIAERMLAKMDTLDGYEKDMPVLIAGAADKVYPLNSQLKQMSIGQISEWGFFWPGYGGIKSGWYALYRDYFGVNMTFCSEEEYTRITNSEEFENMGIFPDNSCIRLIDGIVVFKLTDNPAQPN